MNLLTILLLAAWLCGCGTVYVPEPIGEEPLNIEGEEAEWEGTWEHSCCELTVKVADSAKGILQVYVYMEGAYGAPETASFDAYLRQAGIWTFISARIPDHEGKVKDSYHWARIKMPKRTAILWIADAESFAGQVERGQMAGVIQPVDMASDVFLDRLTPDHLELITAQGPILFWWDEPAVLVKSPH